MQFGTPYTVYVSTTGITHLALTHVLALQKVTLLVVLAVPVPTLAVLACLAERS